MSSFSMSGCPISTGSRQPRGSNHGYPIVEVIILSGHASIEASIDGMRLGAFDYLLKPVDIDELVYKIEDAHRKKNLQEEKIRRLEDRSGTADVEADTNH